MVQQDSESEERRAPDGFWKATKLERSRKSVMIGGYQWSSHGNVGKIRAAGKRTRTTSPAHWQSQAGSVASWGSAREYHDESMGA
jgi:hypothetical protein